MRLIIYGLNSAPEPIGIGRYTGELARWLGARGHDVEVLAAPPYYPAWRLDSRWRRGFWSRDEEGGVVHWRAPLYVPARPSGGHRILHLLSFAVTSAPLLLLRVIRRRPRVLLCVLPSLALAPAAWLAARLVGAALWFHVQDLEVEAALGLGFVKRGRVARWALAVEAFVLRRAHLVSSISARMLDAVRAKGVAPERLALLPNWVDTREIRPFEGPSPLRAELGLGSETKIALYSGNLGRKQGLEILVEAARLLAHDRGLTIVICGEGPKRPELEDAARELGNLRLLPLQPAERLNALLGLADIHLLPQRADAADLVMPSKLPPMLASGRPVLATAAPGTALFGAVEGCGFVTPPEDARAFADALRQLAGDAGLRHRLGLAARARAVALWDREKLLPRFQIELLRLGERRLG